MRIRLADVAHVIRSKNAGPFELTLDILFQDRRDFESARRAKVLDRAFIARLYRLPVEDVLRIIYFEPAHAVKITLRRRVVSGAPGDSDIYGAQQHAPLLDIEFAVEDQAHGRTDSPP
ncbi:MAG: DUF4387 domain-containing protein [Pirellulaceae bacterium]|jgi:hypothetical protein|nr:DUF4387 domain-containing protein [Pirellulaceae bacterium]